MMKWKVLNGIVFLLLWLAITGGHYHFHYPAPLAIRPLLHTVEWKPLSLLYLALLPLAFTLSFIFNGKLALQKIFLKTTFFLQLVAMIGVVVFGSVTLIKKRSELNERFSEVRKKAIRDIEADSIYFISYGFSITDSNYLKRDSIMATYGIYHTPICIIDPFSGESDLYYERLTQDRLDQRNGKNWRAKMQKELEAYPPHKEGIT